MNKPVGTLNNYGYKRTRLDSYDYLNSALAFCLYYGRWPLPKMVIDHIDNNTLNDRKENLREVSNAENMRNRKELQSNNKSGVVGVCWAKIQISGTPSLDLMVKLYTADITNLLKMPLQLDGSLRLTMVLRTTP